MQATTKSIRKLNYDTSLPYPQITVDILSRLQGRLDITTLQTHSQQFYVNPRQLLCNSIVFRLYALFIRLAVLWDPKATKMGKRAP